MWQVKKKIHSGKRVAAAGRRWNGGEERKYNRASLPGAAVHTGGTSSDLHDVLDMHQSWIRWVEESIW